MSLVVADTGRFFICCPSIKLDSCPGCLARYLFSTLSTTNFRHPTAPRLLKEWAFLLPTWLEVVFTSPMEDETLQALGAGKQAAISLALSMRADLILIDERKGTKVAIRKGLEATGTLGILRAAARLGLADLADCFERLKLTNFRYRQETMNALLAEILKREEY